MSGEYYGPVADGRQRICYYPGSTHGGAHFGCSAPPVARPSPSAGRHAGRCASHSRRRQLYAQYSTFGDCNAWLSCRKPLDGSCSRRNSSVCYRLCNTL